LVVIIIIIIIIADINVLKWNKWGGCFSFAGKERAWKEAEGCDGVVIQQASKQFGGV